MPVEDKEPAFFSSLRALVHRGFGVGGRSVPPTTCFKKQLRLFIFNRLELGTAAHTTSTFSSIFSPELSPFTPGQSDPIWSV